MIRAAFVLLAFGALAAVDSPPSAAEINRPWCLRGDFETCTFVVPAMHDNSARDRRLRPKSMALRTRQTGILAAVSRQSPTS
jgi:hypothetical protein